jgi:CHAD domain-containing protein
MSYRLEFDSPLHKQVCQIASEELDDAAKQLRDATGKKRDEAIHEARKSVKKTRALLRLVQPHLGRLYGQENDRLRMIGHQLSEFRDAGAILQTLVDLRKHYQDELAGAEIDVIQQALEKRKRALEAPGKIGEALPKLADALDRASKRAKRWPITTDGFLAVALGLEKRFRLGRKAMRTARLHPTPENYHQWRKRAKDHWYHLRLLENLWPGVMEAHVNALGDLEGWLGDDHNLVVLHDTVARELSLQSDDKGLSSLSRVTEKEQEKLREQAFALGNRVYHEKPGEFLNRIRHLWDAHREEPIPLKEVVAAKA